MSSGTLWCMQKEKSMEGVAGLHALVSLCSGWGQVEFIHWKTWLIQRWSSV